MISAILCTGLENLMIEKMFFTSYIVVLPHCFTVNNLAMKQYNNLILNSENRLYYESLVKIQEAVFPTILYCVRMNL
jgi:hypothetical protein